MKSYQITVSTAYVKLLGDAAAGYILAECVHWTQHYSNKNRTERFNIPKQIANDPGWFYKREEDWEEIGITPRVWRRVKRQLEGLGVLEYQFIGSPPRVWMRINFERLHELLDQSGEFDFKNKDEQNVRVTNRQGNEKAASTLTDGKPSSYNTTNTTTNTEYPLPPRGGNQTAEPLVLDSQEERRSEKRIQIGKMELPTWISRESWQDFIQHRKALRKPMTARAAELILNRLTKIAAEHGETGAQLALLDAIANGWQSPYPPKDQAFRGQGNYQTASERSNELLDRWLQEDNGNEEHDCSSTQDMGSEHRAGDSSRSARAVAGGLQGGSRQSVHSSPEEAPARDAGEKLSDSWADLGIAASPTPRRSLFG